MTGLDTIIETACRVFRAFTCAADTVSHTSALGAMRGRDTDASLLTFSFISLFPRNADYEEHEHWTLIFIVTSLLAARSHWFDPIIRLRRAQSPFVSSAPCVVKATGRPDQSHARYARIVHLCGVYFTVFKSHVNCVIRLSATKRLSSVGRDFIAARVAHNQLSRSVKAAGNFANVIDYFALGRHPNWQLQKKRPTKSHQPAAPALGTVMYTSLKRAVKTVKSC